MSTDKDTKLILLECAKKEFIAKGYNKASLRSICADAGVTTGALYFFFKDKEDLFEEVMKEPLSVLYGVVTSHFTMESSIEEIPADSKEDVEVASAVIKVLFARKDLFLMLLTRAQGSELESVKDQFVSFVEKHYQDFARQFEVMSGKKFKGGEGSIHWVAHNQVDVFIYLLEHCENEKQALKLIPGIVSYLTGGWYALFE